MEQRLIEKRIKLSSRLVGAGLLIQAFSFTILHPLAFMAFLAVGCPLVFVGIGLYLQGLLEVGKALAGAKNSTESVGDQDLGQADLIP